MTLSRALWLTCLLVLAIIAAGGMIVRSRIYSRAPNVVDLVVRTPHAGFNRLLVRIVVCVPGTARCATIDDVMVDTGSTGLRLEASAVPPTLLLPPMVGLHRNRLAECVRFVHDNAWGALFKADLRLGGMIAHDLPIQIIDSGFAHRPESCPVSGAAPTANGTLGIGPWLTDCGGDCVQSLTHPGYFTCTRTLCVPLPGPVGLSYRLSNPVASFPSDNNGVVIDLPAAPYGGAAAIKGTLTFGVGTSDNNALDQARVLRLEGQGSFKTRYDGQTYRGSYIDSGTETYIFSDDRLPRCKEETWAFCVAPERRLEASLIGQGGVPVPVSFAVGDYQAIRARRSGASSSIAVVAAQAGDPFVWGAPFFLGRRIFLVIAGRVVPGSAGVTGPLYAIR